MACSGSKRLFWNNKFFRKTLGPGALSSQGVCLGRIRPARTYWNAVSSTLTSSSAVHPSLPMADPEVHCHRTSRCCWEDPGNAGVVRGTAEASREIWLSSCYECRIHNHHSLLIACSIRYFYDNVQFTFLVTSNCSEIKEDNSFTDLLEHQTNPLYKSQCFKTRYHVRSLEWVQILFHLTNL